MRIPRRVSTLIAVLLLLMGAVPGIAAQIEGDSWTSPTYGFTVSWAGTDWQPDPEGTLTAVGPERLDRLHLVMGINSLYFEGATRYEGNLPACVAQEANLLAQETGVSEIRPYRDADGAPLVADSPNSSAAAFTLALEIADQEIELIDYVECRTLIPGEAVLVITLVSDPASFESLLASVQEVSETIVLAKDAPRDPMAAYGGWLAAATQQPSVAGPLSGEIAFGPGQLGVERAEVDAPDFYTRAELTNPDSGELPLWDIGLGFRDSGEEEQFRLVVDSEGTWFLKDGLGPVITGGTVADFDTSPGGANVIEVVAVGNTGYFAFNERLVSALDLSARTEGGDLFVGAGFFTEDAERDATVNYSDFEIWSLAGVDLGATPRITIDAAVYPGVLATATSEEPLAGPESGELVQTIGSATVVPAGVEVEDFAARAAFVNPSDAADRPWDFGIAFRAQENGDHFRLTVTSDGSWEFQIGLQAELATGTVPSMSFEQDAVNTLDIVVAGDSAGFAVNDLFVAELDTSLLEGASDVWIGSGFHQANAVEEEVMRFDEFTVWPLQPEAVAGLTAPPLATPVAGVDGEGEQIALRLEERDDSGIDALAVLSDETGETTVAIAARGTSGGEVVVIHEGSCEEISDLPAFLLDDLDAAGRSETEIATSLEEVADGTYAIAIHESAENFEAVVACGEIRPGA